MTLDNVAEILDQAAEISDELPRPLCRASNAATDFPIQAMPIVLRDAVLAIHDITQAPVAICAQSVLAVATLATQALADLRLPMGDVRPTSIYFISIAESGERKSSSDNFALRPIKIFEEKLNQFYLEEKKVWDVEQASWAAQHNQILRDKRAYETQQEKQDALIALGELRQAPLLPMLTCPEPTYEGLCRYLAIGQPRVGIFSAEGGQFIGGYGMKEENKLKTASALSELWDGTTIKRVRSGDGTIILPGRRVCMHLMVQPSVGRILLSDRLLADQGLLSRLLIAGPASVSGTRFYKEPNPESDIMLQAYNNLILALLELPMLVKRDTLNELTPRVIDLSSEAKLLWIEWVNEVEAELGSGGKYEPIKGLANKLPEHAARLAAILTLIEDPSAVGVPSEMMQSGIMLAGYYASEALRFFDEGLIDPDLQLAERLLNWMHDTWAESLISLPDIYQRGLNRINNQKIAKKMVSILEDHGWLIKIEGGGNVAGAYRREVWRITPRPNNFR